MRWQGEGMNECINIGVKSAIFLKLMVFQTINLGCIIINILSKFQWTLLLNYQLIYENMIYEIIDVIIL
jgi:uncharacterized membrane protein